MSENPNNRKLTLYDILEISPSASPEIVRASYITLAKKYHPDIYKGDPQKASNMMKAINYAYSVLSDPAERARYDAALSAVNNPTSVTHRETTANTSPPKSPPTPSPVKSEKQKTKSSHIETLVAVVFTCLMLGLCVAPVLIAVINPPHSSTDSSSETSNTISNTESSSKSSNNSYNTAPSYTISESTNKSALLQYMENKKEPEPDNGEILSGNTTIHGTELTVTASRTDACIVKLKNNTGKTVLSFYVRAGNTVTVGVPCGFYNVYFACGTSWYNRTKLFGDNTVYSKDDETLDFINYSWEYTLQPTNYGNFNETYIKADEFKD